MKYTLVKKLGVLSEHEDGNGNQLTKEVNLISWNGDTPVVDIRSWSDDHETMTAGATLTQKELNSFLDALREWKKEIEENRR